MKKIITVGFIVSLGMLFVLAGLGLVTLTQTLIFYIGIALLLLALFFFFRG